MFFLFPSIPSFPPCFLCLSLCLFSARYRRISFFFRKSRWKKEKEKREKEGKKREEAKKGGGRGEIYKGEVRIEREKIGLPNVGRFASEELERWSLSN